MTLVKLGSDDNYFLEMPVRYFVDIDLGRIQDGISPN